MTKSEGISAELLLKTYNALFGKYGPQHWWPGDSPWEICVGAVLTQNTSWQNVEKAIKNLKKNKILVPKKILNCEKKILENYLRPSGYYKLKTKRLLNVTSWWLENVRNDKLRNGSKGTNFIRNSLLSVNGVGHETADSILLYSFGIPVFVIDTYTKRVMTRHFNLNPEISYGELQEIFHNTLPKNPKLFNEFHALFVRVSKEDCKKNICLESCPLRKISPSNLCREK
jgi:endonuclease-3 related protein